jgi:hypothetical protein
VNREPAEALIERIAAGAEPVRPLRPPLTRALLTAGTLLALIIAAIWWLGDTRQLSARYPGREWLMAIELTTMVGTALLAIAGAFSLTVPGESKRGWLAAPLAPALVWLLLAGITCWHDWQQRGAGDWRLANSLDCLLFVLAVGLALVVPLLWRLSRAHPIDPAPVALLGALGAASLAAAMLHFFHPHSVTFLDLAVHVAAMLLVIGAVALLPRPALQPG